MSEVDLKSPCLSGLDLVNVTESATLGKLFEALAKTQAEMVSATKDGKNPHFKSSYATQASVNAAARVAHLNGLCIVHRIMPLTEQGEVRLRSMLGHSSGEWMESETVVPVSKKDAQGVGSAITYAKRYATMALLNMASDDDDGEAAVGRTAAPAAVNGLPLELAAQVSACVSIVQLNTLVASISPTLGAQAKAELDKLVTERTRLIRGIK